MSSQDQDTNSTSGESAQPLPSSETTMPSSPLPSRTKDTETTKKEQQQQQPPNPRLQSMLTKKTDLETKLSNLEAERALLATETKLPSGLPMPDEWTQDEKNAQALKTSNGVIKEHIGLLHGYNEIKDVAQGLMGLIAEARGVRVGVVMEEFGMDEKD